MNKFGKSPVVRNSVYPRCPVCHYEWYELVEVPFSNDIQCEHCGAEWTFSKK